MDVLSFRFLIFVCAFLLLYFLVPKKVQWYLILLANVVFYLFSGAWYILFLIFTSVITFVSALKLEKYNITCRSELTSAGNAAEKKAINAKYKSKKKTLCTIAVILGLGVWVVLKFGNFFIDNINAVIGIFSNEVQISSMSIILPLGISFYTFHAIGYMIDVYRGKYPAEHNFLRFFTFVSFFPHIIQGPFSRFEKLGVQLFEEHSFDYDRFCKGLARILFGVFKKAVIADKLGISINSIVLNYQDYNGIYIIFAMLMYGVQLYCDFTGYMDIMCGICQIMGIELAENFKQPYFSKSIDEYWRRWHITLGHWYRDYIFYPVSMSGFCQKIGKNARKKWGPKMGKLLPGYIALILVWTGTGLWHGATWTNVIWGYLNLLIIVCTMQFEDSYNKFKAKLHIKETTRWFNVFRMIRTYLLITLIRYFGVNSTMPVSASFGMLKKTFGGLDFSLLTKPLSLFVGMSTLEIIFAVLGTVTVFTVDVLSYNGRWGSAKAKCPTILRVFVYVGIFYAIFLVAGGSNDLIGGFMYANF